MSIEELLYDSSRQAILNAKDYVIDNPDQLDEVYELTFSGKSRICQRASRVLNFIAEEYPEMIERYSKDLIGKINKIENQSLLFNILRLYTVMPLTDDEELIGLLADECFNMLDRRFERKAVHIYCIDILYRVSNIFPELKRELKIIIGSRMQPESPGFRSRGGKIIKKIEKELEDLK